MPETSWGVTHRSVCSPLPSTYLRYSRLPLESASAIAGGSGSGKTWLARKLQAAFGRRAARLSLDDFYRDRSCVSPARRARINFDHPRAIAWADVEKVLRALTAGRVARWPGYDFKTHCRTRRKIILRPHPIVLMDGLWLLRRPSLRRLFRIRIFVEGSKRVRLQRRLERDVRSRGRSQASVLLQFRTTVEPMHIRFVAPQRRWADVVVKSHIGPPEVRELARRIEAEAEAMR